MPKAPSKEVLKELGVGIPFSYALLGSINTFAMVAVCWPVFIIRTGGSPLLFSPLKMNPKFMVYLSAVYFSYGSVATPFLAIASVAIAPFFNKALHVLQERLKCPQWLAYSVVTATLAVLLPAFLVAVSIGFLTNCGHLFCIDHATEWFHSNRKCPCCPDGPDVKTMKVNFERSSREVDVALLGAQPEEVLEAASTAFDFWKMQKMLEHSWGAAERGQLEEHECRLRAFCRERTSAAEHTIAQLKEQNERLSQHVRNKLHRMENLKSESRQVRARLDEIRQTRRRLEAEERNDWDAVPSRWKTGGSQGLAGPAAGTSMTGRASMGSAGGNPFRVPGRFGETRPSLRRRIH